jgi:hypothetical protein
MLMEYSSGAYDFGDYVDANPAQLRPCFKRLAEWLQSLQASCNFIHADFKGNNILMDSRNHLRIIDYGWNRMTINGVLITSKLDGTVYTNWRDFTLLAHYIYLVSPRARSAPNTALLQFITQGCLWRGYGNLWTALTYTRNMRNFGAGYMWLDSADGNTNGTPTAVLRQLAAVASHATAASAAPPNPFQPVVAAPAAVVAAPVVAAPAARAAAAPAAAAAAAPVARAAPVVAAPVVNQIVPAQNVYRPARRAEFCDRLFGYGVGVTAGYWVLGMFAGGPIGIVAGVAIAAVLEVQGEQEERTQAQPQRLRGVRYRNGGGKYRATRKVKQHKKQTLARKQRNKK